MIDSRTWLLPAALSLLACERSPAPVATPVSAPPPATALAATVNGQPITRFEVELRRKSMSSDTDDAQALETIILEELRAQRASALGYENDPAWQQEKLRLQAQLNEVRRKDLSRLLIHRDVLPRAKVSPSEARAYFDQHPERFTVQFRALQLVRKGNDVLAADQASLSGGKKLAELGAEPTTLTWAQVPSAWWATLEKLDEGHVSPPLALPGDRFALIEVLERIPVAAPAFESIQNLLSTVLEAERIELLKAQLDAELLRGEVVRK